MFSYPTALLDPVAEPPVTESSAAHVEDEQRQDKKEDGQAT